ncbi:Uncharacterised protein [Yersinia frederiksenii]|nr:Uncharacterised protein [Yersinia frederiksenii]CQH26493.1 Uncharacterised protein [Yersinia frederiksenii]
MRLFLYLLCSFGQFILSFVGFIASLVDLKGIEIPYSPNNG